MNRSTDEPKEALLGPVDDAASSSEDEVEEESEEDEPREETPDLYRNSSLGMYVSPDFYLFLQLGF
jgi:E3 ubiquitin-protein ligase HUWE1